MSFPREAHLQLATHVLRYRREQPILGFSTEEELAQIFKAIQTDWGNDIDNKQIYQVMFFSRVMAL